MLEAANLSCVRGPKRLFAGLSFLLGPGELLWVTGRNGSGKTSLLRLLAGLSVPEEGEVRWKGEPLARAGDLFRQCLLYLGHLPAVKDDLTAIENLVYNESLAGLRLDADRAREALRACGLGGRENLPLRHLSQGQRRRAALARLAFGGQRALWILDEPLVALDAAAVQWVLGCLRDHLAGAGAVVFTCHQEVELAGVALRRLALDA